MIEIPAMLETAGVTLLLHRYSGVNVEDHISEGSQIVTRLGGLPLAIDQASAYMEYKHLPVARLSDFLTQYEAERKKVLRHTTESFWKYTKIDDNTGKEIAINAFTTWEMSFQQLLIEFQAKDAVAHFLTVAGFLGPSYIREFLFKYYSEGPKCSNGWLNIFTSDDKGDDVDPPCMASETPVDAGKSRTKCSQTWDNEKFWHLIHQAHRMSLLQSILPSTEDDGALFLLHPLIRDWLQLRVESRERELYIRETIDLLVSSIMIYETKDSNATVKQSMLQHIDAILLSVKEFLGVNYFLRASVQICAPLESIALFCRNQGRCKTSAKLCREVIAIRSRSQGIKHLDTSRSVARLASILREQGQYVEAEQLLRDVLKIGKSLQRIKNPAVLESMDPATLVAIQTFAALQGGLGKYNEAEQTYRQVVKASAIVFGKQHHNTLAVTSNLAIVLAQIGRDQEAEQTFRETLDAIKRVLGKDHPETLRVAGNLAVLLNSRKKSFEAEAIQREVVEATTRVCGREHPDNLTSMTILASVLSCLGKVTEAEVMNREVVETTKNVLGKDHPDTLVSMHILAGILMKQGKHDEAESILREVIKAQERVLGSDHPSTLHSMNKISTVLMKQGRKLEAEKLGVVVAIARLKLLGIEHPDTRISVRKLLCTWRQQGMDETALAIAFVELLKKAGFGQQGTPNTTPIAADEVEHTKEEISDLGCQDQGHDARLSDVD